MAVGPILWLLGIALTVGSHDIPDARVDRATQITVEPGRLTVDYEVSLAELTLVQELRTLVADPPSGGDRKTWYDRYGQETGPLNARGFLVTIDDEPIDLETVGFDLVIESHPRFIFHFSAAIPSAGRIRVRDANFLSSEGTSRLAIRGRGVNVAADDLPGDVERIPARPTWQLTNAEEKRTRQVAASYQTEAVVSPSVSAVTVPTSSAPASLSGLLDSANRLPIAWLMVLATGLGAVHALQPGHGKTLVAAAVLARPGAWWRGIVLAGVTTITHFGSVLALAVVLWATHTSRFAAWDRGLGRLAGFLIAAIGLYRLGRLLSGDDDRHDHPAAWSDRGLIGVGLAGGIVPCWDAITLVVLASALGRPGLALWLLLGFSLGMAAVLVAIGWGAGRLQGLIEARSGGTRWRRRLSIAGSLAVASIGVYLFIR